MSINLVINDFVGDAAFSGFDEQEPLNKDLEYVTDVVGYDSGKEQRNQVTEQPKRHWRINWPLLDLAARDKLIELYQRCKGRYEDFLFADRWDYECGLTDWSETAIGGETTTQLGKTYYVGETEAWTEDKKKIQPSGEFPPVVKIDAVTMVEGTDFTLDDATGIIDWTAGGAPYGALGAGDVVTANYYFYFKVRFANDLHTDLMAHARLWSAAPLAIVEVIS